MTDLNAELLNEHDEMIVKQQGELAEYQGKAAQELAQVSAAAATNAPDLASSIQKDPMVILDLVHAALTENKGIPDKDFAVMLNHKALITNVPKQVYQQKLCQLLICPHNIEQFKRLMISGLSTAIFPGLGLTVEAFENTPAIHRYVDHKLAEYAIYPSNVDFYHVFSLFVLASMITQHVEYRSMPEQCHHTLLNFFAGYQHPLSDEDKQEMYDMVTYRILNEDFPNLYSEFLQFENELFVGSYDRYVKAQVISYNRLRNEASDSTLLPFASHRTTRGARP